MDSFDAADLRMRVRGAFSGSELRRLLEAWGARPEDHEADSNTNLAHHLVKLGCKLYGPRELIRRLSNEKPLVEWPDLQSDDERWAGPMSVPMSLPAASLAEALPTIVMEAPPEGVMPAPVSVGSARSPLEGGQARLAPTLHEGTPAPQDVDEPPASSLRAPLSAEFTPGRPSAFSPSASPPKSPPYLAIGGIAFGLLGVAFGVGMLVARPSGGPAASGDAPVAERTPRGKSAAGRAATLVDSALIELGTLCEVEIEGDATAEVLLLSLEACGRDEVEKLRRLREKELLLSRRDDLDRDPIPTSTTRPLPIVRQPGGPAPKAPPDRTPQAPKASCRTQCSSSRAACQSDCGPEPTDAARYGAYQSCISRCVADESRCRLGCR